MRTLILALGLLAASCSSSTSEPFYPPPNQPAGPVAEFSLLDTNATSPTAGQMVSPRDYVGNISAWYHGAAT